jgi:glutamyl-tRNA synthetase
MINATPRVRFAPSPTGYLHVGGLRTALYNYLFAKKNNGTFVLRIEDTDRKRFVEGAVDNLIASLRWCGIEYDEGPLTGGACGSYVQSERLGIYREYALKLIETGQAYYCFCDQQRLDSLRAEQEKAGVQKKYDKFCLSLSGNEVRKKLDENLPYVIRMNIPGSTEITFHDVIRDRVSFVSDVLDDQVLMKSDGYPTYHLANVVDDHLMKITHVIRGEEWLSSTPKHVQLYQFFGWEVPVFAHLPLLLNPDRSKLSKRQGDVAVEDYRAKGFLPEALVNFVALLGWTAGDDKEVYGMDELRDAFSLERVNKSGAVFDLKKLHWLNATHLRMKSTPELASLLMESLSSSPFRSRSYSSDYLEAVIEVMRERVEFIHEIWQNAGYFFSAPNNYDEAVVKKRWKPNSPHLLTTLKEKYIALDSHTKEHYEAALKKAADEVGVSTGELIHPLRLALSSVGGGPGLYDIIVIIGHEETLRRIDTAIAEINI